VVCDDGSNQVEEGSATAQQKAPFHPLMLETCSFCVAKRGGHTTARLSTPTHSQITLEAWTFSLEVFPEVPNLSPLPLGSVPFGRSSDLAADATALGSSEAAWGKT
jgi:hypothetical protein